MTRYALTLLLVMWIATTSTLAQEATPASFRWISTLEKALSGSPPGVATVLGKQASLRLRVTFTNFQGPAIDGMLDLPERLAVKVTMNGRPTEMTATVALLGSPGPLLQPGEGLSAMITFAAAPNAEMIAYGEYSIDLDANPLLRSFAYRFRAAVARSSEAHRVEESHHSASDQPRGPSPVPAHRRQLQTCQR